MSPENCPDCGRPVLSSPLGGLCPACLLAQGESPQRMLEEPSTPVEPAPLNPERTELSSACIGRYQLIRIIGEGGFGTVWMAGQTDPVKRTVALKIIKLGMDTRQVVARFEAERQALALMDHPNIARVLDAGATDSGRPYFVMELVQGMPITDYCDARCLSLRERVALMIPVCRAVQHAHQKGIIHRDLKPSNILVTEQDGQPVPKVIDFGVAKAIEEPLTEKTILTRFHQFLGTPAYMSPEQAGLGGLDVDTRSDIYSLGVLLHELLTGGLPFARSSKPELVLQAIREQEVTLPSLRLASLPLKDRTAIANLRREDPHRLHQQIRGDLDWIVLKALEKDRARRYESAADLASDLQRSLDHEPINASPPSKLYVLLKFSRRNRLLLASAAGILSALILGLALALWQAVRATQHARAEEFLRRVAETNESILRQTIYSADMTRAAQALERGDDEAARQSLRTYFPTNSSPDLRGWDWRHLWHRAQGDPARTIAGHTDTVTAIAWLDAGERLLSASYDGTIREWHFETGRELRRWHSPGHRWRGLTTHPSGTNAVSFAVDEDLMAIVDLASGGMQLVPTLVDRTCYALAASPDGQAYVHGAAGWGFTSTNSRIVVRDASFKNPVELPESGSRAAFSPDGHWLATGTWLNRIKLWSWPERELVREFGPVGPVASLSFSPDGQRLLASGRNGEITLWNVADRTLLNKRTAHAGTTVGTASHSPDGRFIASAGGDQTIVLWDAIQLAPIRVLRGYADQVWQVRWTPDGRSLVSTTLGSGIQVWSTNRTRDPDPHGVSLSRPVHFSPDSRLLVVELAIPPAVSVWSTTNGHQILRLDGNWQAHGFVQGNEILAVEDRDARRVEFRRLADLAITRSVNLETAPTNATGGMCRVMSPDGSHLVQCHESGFISVWDLKTGRLQSHFEAHRGGVRKAVFSPDSQWLLSCGLDQMARLWDGVRFHAVAAYAGDTNIAWDVAFSRDGTRVVAGWMDRNYRIFDRTTGRLLSLVAAGEDGIAALPGNGQTLITSSANRRQLRFWNLPSQREAGTLSTQGASGHFFTLSPDETMLVSEAADRTLLIWRAPKPDPSR